MCSHLPMARITGAHTEAPLRVLQADGFPGVAVPGLVGVADGAEHPAVATQRAGLRQVQAGHQAVDAVTVTSRAATARDRAL